MTTERRLRGGPDGSHSETVTRGPDWPGGLLLRGERASEVPVAPAHGLTLVGVDYPPAADLAARASATRRLRVAPPA